MKAAVVQPDGMFLLIGLLIYRLFPPGSFSRNVPGRVRSQRLREFGKAENIF